MKSSTPCSSHAKICNPGRTVTYKKQTVSDYVQVIAQMSSVRKRIHHRCTDWNFYISFSVSFKARGKQYSFGIGGTEVRYHIRKNCIQSLKIYNANMSMAVGNSLSVSRSLFIRPSVGDWESTQDRNGPFQWSAWRYRAVTISWWIQKRNSVFSS